MSTRSLLVVALGLLSTMNGSGLQAQGSGTPVMSARITFAQATCVMGHVLAGSYIIVHDRNKMDSGEPCTTIYNQNGGGAKPVVSFRCVPKPRAAVDRVTVSVAPEEHSPGMWINRLVDYQFAGETEAHTVPF